MLIRPRWKKITADLWENKGRSIMVILSVTVGVFALGMVGVGYYLLPRGIEEVYAANIPENISIRTDYFDDDLIESISNMEAVLAADGERSLTVRAHSSPDAVWENFQIIIVPDLQEKEIKLLTPSSGSLNDAKGQIVLLEDPNNLPGDAGGTLEILLADDTLKQMSISGRVYNYTSGTDQMMYSKVGFVSSESMDFLHMPPYYTTLHVTVENDRNNLAHVQAVADQVVERVEDSGRTVYSSSVKKGNQHPYGNYVSAISGIMGVVGIFIVVLSGALIINTMNALVAQQLRQIGVMKLVGARRRQIILLYILMVFLYGLIALAVAIPGGAFAGYWLSETTAPVLNGRLPSDVTRLPVLPQVVILQVLVALLVPVGAALLPVISGSGVTVQRALSGSLINQNVQQSRFDRWLKNLKFTAGITQLSLRNTFRRKGRLFLTLFTLALGGAILIAVFNVQLSLDNQIERILAYNGGDIFLTFTRAYPVKEIEQVLLSIPDVEQVESWMSTSAQLTIGKEIMRVDLSAPPDDTQLLEPAVLVGRWVNTDDERGMVVNESFWNTYPDLAPGDQIPLEIKDKTEYWTVTGIFHYSGLDEKIAFTNAKSLTASLNHRASNSHYRIQTNRHDLAFQKDKTEQINAYLREMGYHVGSIVPINDFIQGTFEKLDLIIYVLLILATLTSIVGSIGLSGTLSLNVLERTSEIGILRAIGAYDRVISQLIIIEGFMIGFASFLLSLMLSIPMTRLLTTLVNQAIFGINGRMVFTPTGFILWALILLVFSIISSLVPARNATRLTIREVLAYE